ncbi:MAG TPA: ElyC/SanA/YdcF family protein [Steroidobacteraceae bacterium]
MHFLKQLIGVLAMPLVFACVLLLLAGALWLLRWRRTASALGVVTVVAAYLACTPWAAGALLAPLARGAMSPLDHPPQVKFVVVLGSWYEPRDDLPATASLSPDGIARITEGVRLLRLLPGARLVVSGGVGSLSTFAQPSAHGYERLARGLGVEAESIIALDTARDTAEEARDLTAVVGTEPFLLVTSADHLRRAVRLMQRAGLRPIPAAATRSAGDEFYWRQLIPGSSGLRVTEGAIHEYLGLAAISLGLD